MLICLSWCIGEFKRRFYAIGQSLFYSLRSPFGTPFSRAAKNAELAQKSNHNLFIKQQGKTVPPFYHLPRPHYANREPSTALQQRP